MTKLIGPPRKPDRLNDFRTNECEPTDLNRDFDSFYEWSLPKVYRYALAATGDRAVAEDITSEAFLSVVNVMSTNTGSPISTAPRLVLLARLRRIVHNKAVDWIRHQTVKRKSFASLAVDPSREVPAMDPLEHDEQRSMVFYALSQLPEDYQAALQWRYFDEQSVEGVAELGGWSKSAANSLLYRARAAFRVVIDRLTDGPGDCVSADKMPAAQRTKSQRESGNAAPSPNLTAEGGSA